MQGGGFSWILRSKTPWWYAQTSSSLWDKPNSNLNPRRTGNSRSRGVHSVPRQVCTGRASNLKLSSCAAPKKYGVHLRLAGSSPISVQETAECFENRLRVLIQRSSGTDCRHSGIIFDTGVCTSMTLPRIAGVELYNTGRKCPCAMPHVATTTLALLSSMHLVK